MRCLTSFLFGIVKADAILRHPDVAGSHGLQQPTMIVPSSSPSPVERGLSDGSWATGNRSPYALSSSNHSSPQYQPSSPDNLSHSDGWVQRAAPGMMSMPADSLAEFPTLFDGYTADCLDDLFNYAALSRHHPHLYPQPNPHSTNEHLPLSAVASSSSSSMGPVTTPSGPGSAGSGVTNRRGNAKSKAAVGTLTHRITIESHSMI